MLKEQLNKGDKVLFGRAKGEQTLGVIVKLNDKKAQIKSIKPRGNNPPGEIWDVPYSLISLANDKKIVTEEPLEYDPFAGIDNLILKVIFEVFLALSPENLTADGELDVVAVRKKRTILERQLCGLQLALGRDVSEDQIYGWNENKIKFEETLNNVKTNSS